MKPAALLRLVGVWCGVLHDAHAKNILVVAYLLLMTFLRIKTIKNRKHLYRQTSVRKGKKVKSIMQYVCSLGWIAAAAASPGYIGSKGHQSTDKRALKHQDNADRERFNKEMEHPRERFMREAAKRDALKGSTQAEKNNEVEEAIRDFKEARGKKKSRLEALEAYLAALSRMAGVPVPCHLCGTYRRVKLIRHKSCGVADTHAVIYTLVILHPGNVQGTLT